MKLENYALQAEPLKSRRALTANHRRIPMIAHGCLSSLVLFTVLCVGCGDGADDPPPRMVQLWILNLSQECVATAATISRQTPSNGKRVEKDTPIHARPVRSSN